MAGISTGVGPNSRRMRLLLCHSPGMTAPRGQQRPSALARGPSPALRLCQGTPPRPPPAACSGPASSGAICPETPRPLQQESQAQEASQSSRRVRLSTTPLSARLLLLVFPQDVVQRSVSAGRAILDGAAPQRFELLELRLCDEPRDGRGWNQGPQTCGLHAHKDSHNHLCWRRSPPALRAWPPTEKQSRCRDQAPPPRRTGAPAAPSAPSRQCPSPPLRWL